MVPVRCVGFYPSELVDWLVSSDDPCVALAKDGVVELYDASRYSRDDERVISLEDLQINMLFVLDALSVLGIDEEVYGEQLAEFVMQEIADSFDDLFADSVWSLR